ncbi:hypothetical protein EMCRGX_G028834 [Ephydatia muelleri]
MCSTEVAVLLLCLLSAASAQVPLRFANIYGDHMVIQRGKPANVWGYVQDCSGVTVGFNGKKINATVTIVQGSNTCQWNATLPATTKAGPFSITATSGISSTASITDVLFGDVYFCAGQGNMQFTVVNASAEIAKAQSYPSVRLFTAGLNTSATPLSEVAQVLQPWSVGSSVSVNGGNWTYFSAVCWFFGQYLYDHLQYPVGLIVSSWNNTPIEAWCSPDVLTKCNSTSLRKKSDRPHPVTVQQSSLTNTKKVHLDTTQYGEGRSAILKRKSVPMGGEERQGPRKSHGTHAGSYIRPKAPPSPSNSSVLWNAMVYPFLNMTIFGVIWYEGGADALKPNYNCTFPALIADWRAKWYDSTNKKTSKVFPFGFVQLAGYGTSNATVGHFPDIRWAQTGNRGFVPNTLMPNVFMAVATDLGDPSSPAHPGDKQDVGARLVLGARALGYGESGLYYSGPIAQNATLSSANPPVVSITFGQVSPSGLQINAAYPYGYQLQCKGDPKSILVNGTLTSFSGSTILVSFPSCPSGTPTSVYYAWLNYPCPFKMCSVYSGDLPAPPFHLPLK